MVGWTDPKGGRSAFGALLLGLRDKGRLRYAGRAGSGFDEKTLALIHERLRAIARETPPVDDPPTGSEARRAHWVEPTLVAEVTFTEWTADGHLRHPVFLGLREDKPAEAVVDERYGLTNPDRVYWPESGITKLELVRYYEQVASAMLPHCERRPLSLVRCPEGLSGECFFQKHVENFPASVHAVSIFEPSENRDRDFPYVADVEGLIGLAQMGVLEIHTWGGSPGQAGTP